MEEEADAGVFSRAERKVLETAGILQRENERQIFRLVGRVLKNSEAERSEVEAAVFQLQRGALKRKQQEESSLSC